MKLHARGGEGEEHRRLKEYIAGHPSIIESNRKLMPGKTEHTILSGDQLDVFFESPEDWVCVEVKGKWSSEVDILRGIFQCVKYKAVLEAQRHYTGGKTLPTIRVVLVLGGELPESLRWLREILKVEVKPNVAFPASRMRES